MHPGMEFRYAGNGKGGGSWNTVHKTPNRPAGFFCEGPGHRYLAAMDNAMNQDRASTNARTTLGAFKAVYYGCERAFRAWLLDQPPQATLDFVRDFGEYDRRLAAMMMRYEARSGASGYTPIVFRAGEGG